MSTPPTSTDVANLEKAYSNARVDPNSANGEKEKAEDTVSELTWRSGLAVAGSALAYFVTVGFLNAAGVFIEYYTSTMLQGTTNFQISWLSSFALFAIFACAPLAGLLADKYGPTLPIAGGAVVQLIAVFMISLCKEYYQFFLAQGALLAIGMSFVAIPASGIVPRYFKRRRALASGISVAGSSLGGVIWPIVMDQLLYKHKLSFTCSMRIVGFIMIPLLGLVILSVRLPADAQEKVDGKSAAELREERKAYRADLKKPTFVILCAGLFFYYLAFFNPFLFVSTYAVKLGMSRRLAFYLVSIVNGASFFGRILPGFVADRWGRFNILIVSSFFAGIVAFCWTTATDTPGVVVWIAAYGFTSGAILSLQLACATTIVNEKIASTAVGIGMGSGSISGLFGSPIGGQLSERGYLSLAIFTGSMLLVGTFLTACSRFGQNHGTLLYRGKMVKAATKILEDRRQFSSGISGVR